jgi:hypothetical protein
MKNETLLQRQEFFLCQKSIALNIIISFEMSSIDDDTGTRFLQAAKIKKGSPCVSGIDLEQWWNVFII